ncbi:MAG: hypothetical protein LBH03_06795, partial [Holophagales bacterium]|nr:hypothetical protein [Holophagales bacterium]
TQNDVLGKAAKFFGVGSDFIHCKAPLERGLIAIFACTAHSTDKARLQTIRSHDLKTNPDIVVQHTIN